MQKGGLSFVVQSVDVVLKPDEHDSSLCTNLERFCPAGTEIWLKMLKLVRSRSHIKIIREDHRKFSIRTAYTSFLACSRNLKEMLLQLFCDSVGNS